MKCRYVIEIGCEWRIYEWKLTKVWSSERKGTWRTWERQSKLAEQMQRDHVAQTQERLKLNFRDKGLQQNDKTKQLSQVRCITESPLTSRIWCQIVKRNGGTKLMKEHLDYLENKSKLMLPQIAVSGMLKNLVEQTHLRHNVIIW